MKDDIEPEELLAMSDAAFDTWVDGVLTDIETDGDVTVQWASGHGHKPKQDS